MNHEVGRRVFVGSMAAGLPFLSGTALVTQSRSDHDHAVNGVDHFVDYLVRQMAATHNAAQRGPRGDHFRALAAQLRTLSVYERHVGLDDRVRTEVRRRVDRQGRSSVLFADEDPGMRRKNLQAFGFRTPNPPRQGELTPSHEQREAALDELLVGGVTPVLDRTAGLAEKAAVRIDARAGRTLIARDDWWGPFCGELWRQYQQGQLLSALMGSAVAYSPLVAPVCAAMQGGAAALLLVYLCDCTAYF